LKSKFFGVVEAFYGKPYTFKERHDLIVFLSDCGLNTYVYGPKNDVFHRKKWQQPYPNNILKEFEKLVHMSKKHSMNFNYALSPVLKTDTEKVIEKVNSMVKIGITHFSLFFDDIDVELSQKTAETQVTVANELLGFLKNNVSNSILFFCPTQYRGFLKTEYIKKVSQTLDKDIFIMWTGKQVVSKKITVLDLDKITEMIKRKPLIWDNIFANDYIPGMILRFPYRHREPEIIAKVKGILINPMNQYTESKPLIYTAAKFFRNPHAYVPRKAWREVMRILDSQSLY